MQLRRSLTLLCGSLLVFQCGICSCKARGLNNHLAGAQGDEDSSSVFDAYPLDKSDRKRLPFAFKAIENALAEFASGAKYPPFDIRDRAKTLDVGSSPTDWNILFNKIENPIQDQLANLNYEALSLSAYAAWFATSIPTIERVLQYYNIKQDIAAHRISLANGPGLRVISAMFRERRDHANQDLIDYFQANIPQMNITKMALDMKLKYPDIIRSEGDVYRKVESLELSYAVIWRTPLPAGQIEGIEKLTQSILYVTLPFQADSYLTIASRLIDLTNDPERVIQNARSVMGVDPDALRNILHFTGKYLKKTDMSDAQIDLIVEMRKREKPATIAEIALALCETEGAVRSRISRLIEEGRLVKLKEIESTLKLDINLIDTQNPKRFEDARFSELRKNGEWNQDKFYDYLLTFGDQTFEWQAEQLSCDPSTIRAWRVRFGIHDPARDKRSPQGKGPNLTQAPSATTESFDQVKARLIADFRSTKDRLKRQKIILEMYRMLFERDVTRNPKTQNLENIPTLQIVDMEFGISTVTIASTRKGVFPDTIATFAAVYQFLKFFDTSAIDDKSLAHLTRDLLFNDFGFNNKSQTTVALLDAERYLLQERTLDRAFSMLELNLELSRFHAYGISKNIDIRASKLTGTGTYAESEGPYARRVFDNVVDLENNVARRFNIKVSNLETKFLSGEFGENDRNEIVKILAVSPFLGPSVKFQSEFANGIHRNLVRKSLIIFSCFRGLKDMKTGKSSSAVLGISMEKLFSMANYKKGGAFANGVFDSIQEYHQLVSEGSTIVADALQKLKLSGVQLTPFQDILLANTKEISSGLKINSPPASQELEVMDQTPENPNETSRKQNGPCEKLNGDLHKK